MGDFLQFIYGLSKCERLVVARRVKRQEAMIKSGQGRVLNVTRRSP
jgi:hypothetical protein